MAPQEHENQVVTLICCDHFVSDIIGKPSYIGVFDRVALGFLARFFVIAQIQNCRARRITLILRRPDDSFINLGEMNLNQDQLVPEIANAIWEVQGLPFAIEGRYVFELLADGHKAGSLVLTAVNAQEILNATGERHAIKYDTALASHPLGQGDQAR